MNKLLLYLVVLFISQILVIDTKAQFPYVESFRNSTATGIVFGGEPSAFLTASGSNPLDQNGSGFLRLTNATRNQKGFAYSTSNFPSSNGLRVEFEYFIYGGSGADGISFFLFDATAAPFVIGGFGGSLGYAQITTTNPVSPGVSKGYLAIGLDEYGNFSNPTEGRQGGDGFIEGSVTLRGKGNGSALTADNYKFLTTVKPDQFSVPLIGNRNQRIIDSTSIDYRRVAIELRPNMVSGGYFISVFLTRGGNPLQRIRVINDYYYPELAPSNLRYGFASSTGDLTNFHEIRNVEIDVFNPRPTGTSDNAATIAGTPIIIPVTNNDQGRTGATVIEGTRPANGTIVINPDNTITYLPTAGFSGRDTFTYRLRTAGGVLSDPITVSVNVRPLGVADIVTTTSGVPVISTVKVNDPSQSGTIVIQATPPTNGTIIINANNTVTYTPNAGFSGKDSYTYILRTADGLDSDPITVSINVRPIGSNDVSVTSVNVPVPILVKDNDLSKTGTTINLGTPPLHGTLTLNANTGAIIFTPSADYAGLDTFTYTLKTADGLESDPVTVAVTIKPVGSNDEVTTPTNTPITLGIKDNDLSKLGTTVTIVGAAANGTTIIDTEGKVLYVPATDFSGKDLFTYTLTTTDGSKSDPISVIVNVKPVGSPDNIGAVNGVTPIDVKANDPSKQNTTVLISSQPGSGTVTVNPAGIVTYVPNAGFSGTDRFTYTLRTPDGLVSDPITVTLTSNPAGLPDLVTTPARTQITIPVKDNDPSKTGTTVILVGSPQNGTVVLNANNLPVYTPADSFSGKDTFTYKLRDLNGIESSPIIVTINVKPIGTADNVTTPLNTPVTINIKNNDPSSLGTLPVIVGNPMHGTVSIDGSGNAIFVPTGGYTGTDVFTYKLRTADGIESDPITVTVSINPLIVAPDVILPANTGTPVIVPIPVVQPGGSYTIITQPSHGIITTDPNTGRPIYTPNPGYSGPDEFTYTLKDPNGVVSTPGKVTITVTTPAKIGLAKSVRTFVRNLDGTYNVTYIFTLKNYGDFGLERVTLTDNLALAFPGTTVEVLSSAATGSLRINTTYNGVNNTALLLITSTLAANATETVTLDIRLILGLDEGKFNNFAIAEGYGVNTGTLTQDQSTNGLIPDPDVTKPGDVSPSELTPVTLERQPMKIPGGFSPNGDGINDFFVIENAVGKTINLEVYNRWGNRIFRSKDYKNTWDGRTTEGIYVGTEVPVGTYYYSITIDGKDRKVGVLTINR